MKRRLIALLALINEKNEVLISLRKNKKEKNSAKSQKLDYGGIKGSLNLPRTPEAESVVLLLSRRE